MYWKKFVESFNKSCGALGKAKVSIERSGAGRSGLGGYSFGKSSSKKKVKKEGEEEYEDQISSSDSEGGPKIDVEYIQLISDSEEGEDNDKGEKKPRIHAGGFPVRIERREHVDRAKVASTTEGTKKKSDDHVSKDGVSKGKAKEKDVQFLQEERKWKGVYEDTDSDPPSIFTLHAHFDIVHKILTFPGSQIRAS